MKLGLFLLIFIQIGFSYSYPLTKELLKSLDPLIWSTLRASIAAICLFLIARVMKLKKFRHRVSRFKLMGLAFCGVSFNQYFFIKGLEHSSPTDAAIMATTIPIWVFVGSLFMRLEKFSFQRLWGIAFAILGVLVLFGRPSEKVSFFLLLNGFTYAVYVVWGYDVMKRENPIFLLSHLFFYGSLGLLSLTGFELLLGIVKVPEILDLANPQVGWPILQIIAFGTLMPYIFYSYCTKKLPATVLAMGATIQPPITAFLDFLINGNTLQPILVLSGSLIAFGVLLTTRPFRTQKAPG